MLYFIVWVVFLLLAIIAVPVASMLDKSKQSAAYADSYDESDPYADPDGAESLDDGGDLEPLEDDGFGGGDDGFGGGGASDGFGDVPEAGEADFGGGGDFGDAELGDDDFAAFE